MQEETDRDRAAARRERLLLGAVLAVLVAGIFAFARLRSSACLRVSHTSLIGFALLTVGLTAAVVLIMRRRLAESAYDRRVASLFLATGVATLIHRVAALRLGTPVDHVLVDDLVVIAVLYGTAAITFAPWMAWLAALALAGAAVGLFEPAWALLSLSLSTLMSVPVLLSFWRRA